MIKDGKQTWEFFSRLMVSLSVLGTAFALGSVSVVTVSALINRKSLSAEDTSIRLKLNSRDAFTPVETQISEHEVALGQLKDSVAIEEEKRNLASLYWKYGKKSETLSAFARSEQAYRRAINLDPSNAQYMAELASLYSATAARQDDSSVRVTLYQNSSSFYRKASYQEPRQAVAQSYTNNAATTALSVARELKAIGHPEEAMQTLRTAATWSPNSEIARQINAMLDGQ